MRDILFYSYLLLFLVVYCLIRHHLKKRKEWTGYGLFLALCAALFNPLVLFLALMYFIITLDFWDKDLPKWF